MGRRSRNGAWQFDLVERIEKYKDAGFEPECGGGQERKMFIYRLSVLIDRKIRAISFKIAGLVLVHGTPRTWIH